MNSTVKDMLEAIIPFLMLGVFLTLFIAFFIMLAHLIFIGLLVGVGLYGVNALLEYFGKRNQPSSGRVIEHE